MVEMITMDRFRFLFAAFIALASSFPGVASAQLQVEVARETDRLGELGMSWQFDGPFNLSDDGARRATSPPSVSSITPCSPAHRAGLEPGDILLKVNGRDGTAGRLFPNGAPGTPYHLEVQRGTERWTVLLEVGPSRENALQPVTAAPVGTMQEWGCQPAPHG